MAKKFELEVFRAGKAVKTLTNDSGKMPFEVIEAFALLTDDLQGFGKNSDIVALARMKETLEPLLESMFSDYEAGDIGGIDVNDLFGFIEELASYSEERFGNFSATPKNRQTAARKSRPRKKS